MKLEDILLSENKSDREREILYDLIYIWNLKKNKLIETMGNDSCHLSGTGVGKEEIWRCWSKGISLQLQDEYVLGI